MTPEKLIEAFDTLAEAPNGIDRLRELVLHLAVRGKLVPQDPEDEPASALLERIAEEKERLVREGKIRRPKPLPPVSEDEVPFEIPAGWSWFRLGEGFHVEMGQSPSSKFYNQVGDGMPFFQGKADFGRRHPVARYWCVQPTKLARPGDVLLSVRAPVGPTNVADQTCCIGRGLAAIRPLAGVPTNYVLCLFRAFEKDLESLSTGTTFQAISKRDIEPFVVPLPPLPEQHRIVAKVDELMTLIDQLEAARNAREATRAALRDAALAALQDADTAEEVEAALNRIAERMDDLFTDPADIDPLRQTILQLAVRGRLVPQDPNDEPASVLLERIAKEKERLVKEGKIRKPKALPPVSEEDLPFKIPEGWTWVRGNDLFQFVTSGSRGWAKFYSDHGPIFLRIGNLDYETTELDLTNIQRVTPPEGAEGSRTAVDVGDILISITGDTGMVGLVPEGLGAAYINQHIALCRPWSKVSSGFLARTCTSPLVRNQLWGHQRGIKNSLGLNDIRLLAIPLPPLAEQHRIVAKVDELMALLDRLEEHLDSKTTAHDAFAAAAVHELSP